MTTLNTIIEEENEAQKTNEDLKREYYKWHYDDRDTITPADIADWWLQKLTLKDEAHRKEMEEAHQRGFELGMNTAEEQHTGRVIPDVPTKEVTEELPTNH